MVFFASYQVRFSQEIIMESTEQGLDKNLVYAIIKTESGFDEKAVSSVGAKGLMQILPSTASWVCSKINIEYSEDILFNPQINIKIGCYYLKYLIDLFDNNIENAICSYNAGQNAVLSWLADKRYSDDGENLKEIPYKETKNYLKKVKFNKFIYDNFVNRY